LFVDVCETAGTGHVRKKTMTSLVCLSERSFRDSKFTSTDEMTQRTHSNRDRHPLTIDVYVEEHRVEQQCAHYRR
jgi:hypothetical protein